MDEMHWEPDNGYVPGPGRRCLSKIVESIAWIWAAFAVVVGA